MISRTKMQARVQGRFQLKDSNESKLVPTNLDRGPHLKEAKKSKASTMAIDGCDGNWHYFLLTTPCI
jgi:hypothetical protein